MNAISTLLLYLLGAALLGCVIGWCVKALLIAGKENKQTSIYNKEKRALLDKLAEGKEENEALQVALSDVRASFVLQNNKADQVADMTQKVDAAEIRLSTLEQDVEDKEQVIAGLQRKLSDATEERARLLSDLGRASENRTNALPKTGAASRHHLEVPVLSKRRGQSPEISQRKSGQHPSEHPNAQPHLRAYQQPHQQSHQQSKAAHYVAAENDSPMVNTDKYSVALMGTEQLEVDADIAALSDTLASANTMERESLDFTLDSTADVPQTNKQMRLAREQDTGRQEIDSSSKARQTTPHTPGSGMFSGFNKRK